MKDIVPEVKKLIVREGYFVVPASVPVFLPFAYSGLQARLNSLFVCESTVPESTVITFFSDLGLPAEGYRLSISPTGISIACRDYAGAFYALITLGQWQEKGLSFPCVEIEDWPDLEIRGFLLDISRDKIPTLSTLKEVIDKMASLKMNHLELYIEGFSFEYSSFPGVSDGETPLTLPEFRELERYANRSAIDLCGNMNGFGHMTKWLQRPEFHRLAECPFGFRQWGYHFPASTLNPLDPESFRLVSRMYGDLLPHTGSPYFNINCDEPFELGRGRSKNAVRNAGLGKVYVDYVSQLVELVHEAGKSAFVWGDVLIDHPEVLPHLPTGMIFLDWGYDRDYAFEDHMKKLAELKVPFIGCPGTSSWNSFASRKADMLATTKNAADNAKKYGGMGLMITDWGDFGHLQYLPFSYPGLIYSGLVSWSSSEKAEDLILSILTQWVGISAAQGLWDLAGYSALENKYVRNGTLAFDSVMFADPSEKHPLFLKKYVLKNGLGKNVLTSGSRDQIVALTQRVLCSLGEEDTLVADEIRQTIRLIRTACNINLAVNRDSSIDRKTFRILASTELATAITEHERLWNRRNKTGGLTRSLSRLKTLKSIVESMY